MKEEQFEEMWLKVVGEEIQAQQEKSIKRTQGIASKCVCYVGGFLYETNLTEGSQCSSMIEQFPVFLFTQFQFKSDDCDGGDAWR